MFTRTAQLRPPGLSPAVSRNAVFIPKYLGPLQIKACDAGLYLELPRWTPFPAGPLIPTLEGIGHPRDAKPM